MDPHRILGTTTESTAEEIISAYRVRARKHHPDAGGDDWAFILVERAYQYVSAGKVGRWPEEMAWTETGQAGATTGSQNNDRPATPDSTASGFDASSGSPMAEQANEAAGTNPQTETQEPQLGFREILTLLIRHTATRVRGLASRTKILRPILNWIACPLWLTPFMRCLSEMVIAASIAIVFRGVTGYNFPFATSWWQSIVFWSLLAWVVGDYRRKLSNGTVFKAAAFGLICAAAVLFSVMRERDRVRTVPSPSSATVQPKQR